eukprot:scaffold935_cov334-Prasinococcus_capsulatus_cf.AAC.7
MASVVQASLMLLCAGRFHQELPIQRNGMWRRIICTEGGSPQALTDERIDLRSFKRSTVPLGHHRLFDELLYMNGQHLDLPRYRWLLEDVAGHHVPQDTAWVFTVLGHLPQHSPHLASDGSAAQEVTACTSGHNSDAIRRFSSCVRGAPDRAYCIDDICALPNACTAHAEVSGGGCAACVVRVATQALDYVGGRTLGVLRTGLQPPRRVWSADAASSSTTTVRSGRSLGAAGRELFRARCTGEERADEAQSDVGGHMDGVQPIGGLD